ncbi:hypothetical protein VNI00_007421 [Paramarasmius palmivorus]|uniref:Protein kinase domain-containing protein n=1 Tax=Paramarasmius palmivorus TaxID=297713 RepID=A0AAW0D4Z9_9AGAR
MSPHPHHLQPIMIPELAYSPSDSVFPSPTESESLHTPCFPEQPHVLLQYPSDTPPTKVNHIHGNTHEIIPSHESYKYRPMEEHNRLPSLLLDALSNSTDVSPPLSPGQYSPIHESTMSPAAYSPSPSPEIFQQSEYHHCHSSSSPSSHSTPAKHLHKSQNTYPSYQGSRPVASSYNLESHLHSPHFPRDHKLNAHFVRTYQLEDELGSGGYGFVMTAKHRRLQHEVAVKFIIKSKVPEHAWMEHELYGRLPTEVMLLSVMDHENIVKCLDLFEDNLYFYLVQELHGSPWQNPSLQHDSSRQSSSIPSTLPALIPSHSADSLSSPSSSSSQPSTPNTSLHSLPDEHSDIQDSTNSDLELPRPKFSRRASHDLFECIEQSDHKRLTEEQARYVFAQIVDAVHYLDSQGVSHRDIKDENIVIDRYLKVKLIDFGSAIFVDPNEPRPYYTLFYGTTAYAASEILQKKSYQAAPAEVWTLGVLLSYLLTGTSPFPSLKDAAAGRMILPDCHRMPRLAVNLMRLCLDPNPETRITIAEVRSHPWLNPRA